MRARHLGRRDVVGGALRERLDTEAARHLESCVRCAAQVRATERMVATLREDSVPDPGELFWGAFKQRVMLRTREAQPETRQWRWRELLAAGLAAGLAIGMTASVVHWRAADPGPAASGVASSWTPLPAPQSDEAYQFLQTIAASGVDSEEDSPCWMGECLGDLTDAEARVVREWLESEVGRES